MLFCCICVVSVILTFFHTLFYECYWWIMICLWKRLYSDLMYAFIYSAVLSDVWVMLYWHANTSPWGKHWTDVYNISCCFTHLCLNFFERASIESNILGFRELRVKCFPLLITEYILYCIPGVLKAYTQRSESGFSSALKRSKIIVITKHAFNKHGYKLI